MRKLYLFKTILLLCALVAGSVSVGATDMVFTPTSYSVGTLTGAPDGVTATFASTYTSNANQITKDNSHTLTLKGMNGYTITKLVLSMKSNKSAGAGTLSYSTDAATTYTYIVGSSGSGVAFSYSAWYGSYSQSYDNITKDVDITCGESDVKIVVAATTNSLYCQSYTLTYESSKTPTAVSISESSWSFNLADGVTKTLTASASAGETPLGSPAITWRSSDETVATVAGGVVTPQAAGTTTITAEYPGNDTYAKSSATCAVTVSKATTAVTITPNGGEIDLKPANKVNINLSAGVKATKSDASQIDVASPTIAWSVISGSDVVDVSDEGVVSGKAVGTATIKAAYAGETNYEASNATCTVTVTDTRDAVSITGISAGVNPIVRGNTTTTTVTANQGGWTPSYTYSSSDTDVATIAADGTITAKTKGTTTITATLNIAANDANYILGETTSKSFELVVKNPSYTATFSVNGDASCTALVEEDQSIPFPTAVTTDPGDGEFPEIINSKTFVGWYTDEYTHATDAPEFVNTTSTVMGGANITYYAVYAMVTEVESDDVNDAVLSQTLQYDTWTYSGTTDNKTSYRLFGSNAYIESSSFDLSKLMKVVVYGGTYGGATYNTGIICDEDNNKWDDIVLSGTNHTKAHTYVGSASLTGNKKLRIKSTCGGGSSSGLRISKVEIFVKGINTEYSNYSTTVSLLPIPEITMSDVEMTWGDTDKSVAPSAIIGEGAYDGSFTFESSNANLNVASGGKLTCNVPGAYTVTARIAATGSYQAAEKTCNVIVNKKSITVAFANSDVQKTISDTSAENKHNQAATVTPVGYDGTVSYEISGDTGGASIEGSEVTYSKSGTITVTATAPATALYYANTASYDLNLSHANIAQVKALTNSATEYDFVVNFSDAYVTYVKDNYAYIQDGSAAVMVNFANHGLTAGKKINGKASGTVKANNQIDVLIALDLSEATVSDAVVPAAEVKTLAEIKNAGTAYDGKLVTVNAATIHGNLTTDQNTNNVNIKDGSKIDDTEVQFIVYAPNRGVTVSNSQVGNLSGFVSIYGGSTYRLNIYDQSQIAITRNVATDQSLAFTSDAIEIDEDTEDFRNFTPQSVTGAQGSVTYSITGDAIYDDFNTSTGAFTLKTGVYGAATITATAAAIEVTENGVTTPYNETTKNYTVSVYPRYIVKFYINGTETTLREATHGAGVSVPTPENEVNGYEFVGWSTGAVATTNTKPTVTALLSTFYPENNTTEYHAVYGLMGTEDVTATFIASDITNTPSDGTRKWKHTATGITLYLSAGQRYTSGTPNTFTVTNGTSNYFEIAGVDGRLNSITTTISTTNYKINSVSTGASLSTDGTTQTVTFTQEMNTVRCYATSSYQIRATEIVVNATLNTLSGYTTLLPTINVTITSAKYATFSNARATNFSTTGITVYKAKVEDDAVKLTAVSDGIVPANTGVILYCETADDYEVPFTTTDATLADNELVATVTRTLVAKTGGAGYNYILQSDGEGGVVFNMATTAGAYMPAGRAYLSTSVNAAPARLSVVFGNEETGISEIENGKLKIEDSVYDLQGRRMESSMFNVQSSMTRKGLYIVNGKKVLVK